METVIGSILSDPPKAGQEVQWTLTVAVLILAVLIGWLIRKIDKDAKEDSRRAAEFRASLERHMDETDRRFAGDAERMACIERDYLKVETHYKDIGGWRTDMNELRAGLGDEIRAVRSDMNALIPSLIKIAMQKGVKGGD